MLSHPLKGEGTIADELAQLSGILGEQDTKTPKKNFVANLQSDLILWLRFIQENMAILGGSPKGTSESQPKAQRIHLCEKTRQRFVNILKRTARSHEGPSRQERIFIQQFWYEIQQNTR